MKYADYLTAIRKAIIEAACRAKSNGTVAMSETNLMMVTRFPAGAASAYVAQQAFREALQFTIANDLLAIRIR